MTMGPGKYDKELDYVTEQVGIKDHGGGVIVIVLGGNRGNGFSVAADITTMCLLPDLLADVAEQINGDLAKGLGDEAVTDTRPA